MYVCIYVRMWKPRVQRAGIGFARWTGGLFGIAEPIRALFVFFLFFLRVVCVFGVVFVCFGVVFAFLGLVFACLGVVFAFLVVVFACSGWFLRFGGGFCVFGVGF